MKKRKVNYLQNLMKLEFQSLMSLITPRKNQIKKLGQFVTSLEFSQFHMPIKDLFKTL